MFADTVLQFLDYRSIRALSLCGRYGRDATKSGEVYDKRVGRRWGKFPESVAFDRAAYVGLVAATEELAYDETELVCDGETEDARKRAAVDALLGVVCAMERAVALDSYKFNCCYPGEELCEEDDDEYVERVAAGLCPPLLVTFCGEDADMGIRELALALSASRFVVKNSRKRSTMVRAALLAREVVVKTRGFGIHDTEGDGREVHFVNNSGPSRKIDWMIKGDPEGSLGPAIVAFTHMLSALAQNGPSLMPQDMSLLLRLDDDPEFSVLDFSSEEFAVWAVNYYHNLPEACHLIAPISLMLWSTASDTNATFPGSRVVMEPFTIGNWPKGSARRKQLFIVKPPTCVLEYVGFRYQCDVNRLPLGYREDLYWDAGMNDCFKLRLFVPPSCEPKHTRDFRREGNASVDTTTATITAVLEDRLGEAHMRGILFVTDDDALRFVLQGHYAPQTLSVGMIGSIGPTGISGLVIFNGAVVGMVITVFTMWLRDEN